MAAQMATQIPQTILSGKDDDELYFELDSLKREVDGSKPGVVVYHRISPLEVRTNLILNRLELFVKTDMPYARYQDTITDEADRLVDQTNLKRFITDYTVMHRRFPENRIIILADRLATLVYDNIAETLNLLISIIDAGLEIRFLDFDEASISTMVLLLRNYVMDKQAEKNLKLAQFRAGRGRPSVDVDIPLITALRLDGKTYEEISKRLGVSLSLIYSRMPLEIKREYRGRYLQDRTKPRRH